MTRPAVIVAWTVGTCVAAIAAFLVWGLSLHDPRQELSVGSLVATTPGAAA